MIIKIDHLNSNLRALEKILEAPHSIKIRMWIRQENNEIPHLIDLCLEDETEILETTGDRFRAYDIGRRESDWAASLVDLIYQVLVARPKSWISSMYIVVDD